MKTNSMYFENESIENGEFNKFLALLMEASYNNNSKYYNDIHIIPEDCGAFSLEWVQIPWDRGWGGKFVYIDEEQEIVKAYDLPDKTSEYFHDDEEYNDFLNEWLKNNPGWSKHPIMNVWVNEEETA